MHLPCAVKDSLNMNFHQMISGVLFKPMVET